MPDDVRFDQVQAPPMHPELILDLCLNSSVPLPPMEYSPLRRFSPSEMGHAMACYRSLGMAVDLLEGVEQERGAASAWNAFRFVLDLVGCFGSIVKSVCGQRVRRRGGTGTGDVLYGCRMGDILSLAPARTRSIVMVG